MKRTLRKFLSGNSEFKFKRCSKFSLDQGNEYGLYVHVPFCKNKCPYCPYFKTIYRKEKSKEFIAALKREVDFTCDDWSKVKVGSLYFGGGTPTLLGEDIASIIKYLKSRTGFSGEIAVETSPSDLDERKINTLKRAGVNLISVGIQSFKDNLLMGLGRNYSSEKAVEIIGLLKKAKFDTLNLDMMFALPTQTLKDLEEDLDFLIKLAPSQVTFYPLFTFPYTSVGKFKKVKKLKMPNFFVRRKMYYLICEKMKNAGYEQSSVWAFKKTKTRKFSSVTREFYIGFGPSAGTYTGKNFYFNTFSMEEYLKNSSRKKPVILRMKVDSRMSKLFWLYWRFYETAVPLKDYEKLFGSEVRRDFKRVFSLLRTMGFIEEENEDFVRLNRRGIFYVHLLQNFFALDYVNKIWSKCQEEKSPREVEL